MEPGHRTLLSCASTAENVVTGRMMTYCRQPRLHHVYLHTKHNYNQTAVQKQGGEGGGGNAQLVAVDLEAIEGEEELDALAAEQGGHLALAAKVQHQQLEERVYDNRFIAVPH